MKEVNAAFSAYSEYAVVGCNLSAVYRPEDIFYVERMDEYLKIYLKKRTRRGAYDDESDGGKTAGRRFLRE
ncbi:MAG TPA: hypothetical protein PLO67_06840 [Saprospiraceae bacterium]|nr:hypothetical protein [Saprospiraceae bacterium]HPI06097.1 hypothetical protein [Saprospiraceae bacterium]